MVATIRNLTSSSATSEYFQKDGGYYLRKGDDETDLRAKQEEHRNGSAWYGQGAEALGLEPGERVSAGAFEKLLQGHVIGTNIRLGRLRDGQHEHRPGQVEQLAVRPLFAQPVPAGYTGGLAIRPEPAYRQPHRDRGTERSDGLHLGTGRDGGRQEQDDDPSRDPEIQDFRGKGRARQLEHRSGRAAPGVPRRYGGERRGGRPRNDRQRRSPSPWCGSSRASSRSCARTATRGATRRSVWCSSAPLPAVRSGAACSIEPVPAGGPIYDEGRENAPVPRSRRP